MSLRNSSSLTAPPLPPISLNTPLLNNRSRNITQKVLSLLQIPNNSIKGKKTNRQSFRFSFYQSKNYYHNREKIKYYIRCYIYHSRNFFFFTHEIFRVHVERRERRKIELNLRFRVKGTHKWNHKYISINTNLYSDRDRKGNYECLQFSFFSFLFFFFFHRSINDNLFIWSKDRKRSSLSDSRIYIYIYIYILSRSNFFFFFATLPEN